MVKLYFFTYRMILKTLMQVVFIKLFINNCFQNIYKAIAKIPVYIVRFVITLFSYCFQNGYSGKTHIDILHIQRGFQISILY